MSDKSSREGYGAGKQGKSSSDNPYNNDSMIGRMIDVVSDVVSGNAGNITATNDKNSADWKSGHSAGSADRKK